MDNVKYLTQSLHVYTFACSTCANGGLGESAVNQGCYSWLGYIVPVSVFTDPNSTLFKTLKDIIWSYITKLADRFTRLEIILHNFCCERNLVIID